MNGRATITLAADLLAPRTVEGKLPALGVLVGIDGAPTQCSTAFLRASPWAPSRHADPATRPIGGEVHPAIQGEHLDARRHDRERGERYRRCVGFY